jgi:16S rRNA (guanine1207-N2)-methyltransferase
MSHYFIEDNSLKPDIEEFTYYYKDIGFRFITDAGVFSKGRVDAATDLLIHNLPPLRGSMLDLGCGYGCIGIIMSKAFGLKVTQVDINPTAVKLTEKNCRLNGVSADIRLSDCYSNVPERFDTILINPPIHAGKDITYRMYEEAPQHLNEGGRLYIVTLKKHGAESTIIKLTEVFGNCDVVYKKKGYYVLCCTAQCLML